MWAFCTSPYGLGLDTERFWGLCDRTYYALRGEWERADYRQARLIATLRADLHNTAGKTFSQPVSAEDFLANRFPDLEERIHKLMEQGYDPAEAAAIATSRQTGEHKMYVLNEAMRQAHERKKKRRA